MTDNDPAAPPPANVPTPPPQRAVAPPPGPAPSVVYLPSPPKRRSWFWRIAIILLIVVLAASLLAKFVGSDLTMSPASTLDTTVIEPGNNDQVVAVIHVDGIIADEAARLIELFARQVKDDKDVKAIVLRVNSPGGTISGSDQIHHAIETLRQSTGKKVVVSMGSLAASGGYYISAGADKIIAEPTTITGSIGVIAEWPILKGTMEKIGVQMMIERSDHAKVWKAWENPFEQPAPYQLQDLHDMLNTMQARFEKVVKDGRPGLKITTDQKTYTGADGKEFTAEETVPFNGRVYQADEAKQIGLIDEIGYFRDATAVAATLAKLDHAKIVRYHRRASFFERILANDSTLAINMKLLDDLQTPRIMMIWKVSQ